MISMKGVGCTRGDLVVIYWYDIEDDPTWKPLTFVEKERLPLCKSVGWFVNEDDVTVRLAYSLAGTEDSGMDAGRTLIPKATIKRAEVIRVDELDVE